MGIGQMRQRVMLWKLDQMGVGYVAGDVQKWDWTFVGENLTIRTKWLHKYDVGNFF